MYPTWPSLEYQCWDKECETLYHSFIRAPVGTDSDRATSSYYLGFNRSRSDGKKLLIPPTSRKLAVRRGEASANLLVGLDAPLACALSRQTPSPCNREHTRLVNKELFDLWKIPSTEGHSIFEPFRPEKLAAPLRCLKPEKSPGLDSIFPEFIPHAGSVSNLDFATSSLHAYANSKFQISGKEHE